MHFNKNHIIKLLTRVQNFAADNLILVQKQNINFEDDFDSTYYGLIIRQYCIISDIRLLFTHKTDNSLTSELILFRSLIDDYIHITYIVNQSDKEEQILNFNGDAINKNFKKLSDLATFNEEKLKGKYPYYPTKKSIDEIKEKIKNTPRQQKYILDKDNFKLRTFRSTGNLVRSLNNEIYEHRLIRAYFLWRRYSDFVHYSNFSFGLEQQIDPKTDETYTEFAEIISYSYKTLLNCLSHYSEKYNLEIKDRHNLADYYKESEH